MPPESDADARIPIRLPAGSLGVCIQNDRHGVAYVESANVRSSSLLKPGDRFLAIDGVDVAGRSHDYCAGLLVGTQSRARSVVVSRPRWGGSTVVSQDDSSDNSSPSNSVRSKSSGFEFTSGSSSSAKQPAAMKKAPTEKNAKKLPPKKQAPKKPKAEGQSRQPAPKRKTEDVTSPRPTKKIKKDEPDYEDFIEFPDVIPPAGQISKCQHFYATLCGERLRAVAEKMGTDVAMLASHPQNTTRFGKLQSSTCFMRNTILRIPLQRSAWQMKQLFMDATISLDSDEEDEEENTCVECGKGGKLLMCDGCDGGFRHVKCAGLSKIPSGDWFCADCQDVLEARKARCVPATAAAEMTKVHVDYRAARERLVRMLRARREKELDSLKEIMSDAGNSNVAFVASLVNRIEDIKASLEDAKKAYDIVRSKAHGEFGVLRWSNDLNSRLAYVEVVEGEKEVRIQARSECEKYGRMSKRWDEAVANVYKFQDAIELSGANVDRLSQELKVTNRRLGFQNRDAVAFAQQNLAYRNRVQVEYASLLGEPRLSHEGIKAYQHREELPKFLGSIVATDDADVFALNMLREPDELIMTVLLDGDDDLLADPIRGKSYGIFARAALFDKDRDDELPMEVGGVRDAQRRMMRMLMSQTKNVGMVIDRAISPSTVATPKDGDEVDAKCFDLSELVRGCDCDLAMPTEPTPPKLAESGLRLHPYQQSALRWLLDKEAQAFDENGRKASGVNGELWDTLRLLDPDDRKYHFCELTGSICYDLYDFEKDVEQKDASPNALSLPSGGLLGLEMGLGKTVVALALIESSPMPNFLRSLPRDEILESEPNHPQYFPPTSSSLLISAATLVIVPISLLSQWVQEIERFTPHTNVAVLHKENKPNHVVLASKDVIVATSDVISSFTSQRGPVKKMFDCIKKIHWHRIIIDESHQNAASKRLAQLSATHRLSVTGTPLGSEISDLYGQLRFLRIAPFHRPEFWRNNIEEPFYDHNHEALRVLQKMLSHTVVRFSKRQKCLTLPPRRVETVFLNFGSDDEKAVYQAIEDRNKTCLTKLKNKSLAAVANKFVELNSLATSLRQAAVHPYAVNLIRVDECNKEMEERSEREARIARGKMGLAPVLVATATLPGVLDRKGIYDLAVQNALPSAKIRMREIVGKFQSEESVEIFECPICFELCGEQQVALPPCAHPICKACSAGLLTIRRRNGEPVADCPTCRALMKSSNITFLGDARDAATMKQSGSACLSETKVKPTVPAVASKSKAVSMDADGFRLSAIDIFADPETTVATRMISGMRGLSKKEIQETLEHDRAHHHTLDQSFLQSYYSCFCNLNTKVARLLCDIQAMVSADESSKCVVFSQFNDALDIVARELKARGVGFVMLNCDMKPHEKADALMNFATNPLTKVFLLSMRSGAVGLNLTMADHCFILDPPQNSAVEEQAVSRVHRMGSTRAVTVRRYIMKDTIEDRILSIRRSLETDDAVNTQVCGKVEEHYGKAKAKSEDLGAKRQERVKNLEALYGCATVTEEQS